jgi:lipopolysaccharide/colanic/teichoic acid biosynthesis glycosyltransferase
MTAIGLRPAPHTISVVHRAPLQELGRERWGRRLLNLVAAAVALIVTLPLLLLIAVLIRLTSPGPVLFTQTRIGLDRRALSRAGGNSRRRLDLGGKPFIIYKFRTMRVESDSGNGQVWARPHDPRVTAIGCVIRRFRLDELPQFLNVLRGDMNIVGPRPEQPEIFVHLREQIEGYQRRQRVRPGITGWAQINQGYDRSLDDVRRKVAFDLGYIRRQSPVEDLKIMLRTVPVMIFRRGAW